MAVDRQRAAHLVQRGQRSARRASTRAQVVRARLLNPLATVQVHPTARLGPGFRLTAPYGGTLVLGPGVDVRRGLDVELGPSARVELRDRVVVTHALVVQCTTSVVVEPDAILGQDVLIADGSHRFRDHSRPFLEQGYDFHPVVVGRGAVVHSKCTLVASVGERSVLAAHTLVDRDVPPYCLVAGVPGRVLEYFGPEELRPAGVRARVTRTGDGINPSG